MGADATAIAGRFGIPLAVRLIADTGDAAGWTDVTRIATDGAVLVRPDRIVAWRSAASADPAEFEQALRVILDR